VVLLNNAVAARGKMLNFGSQTAERHDDLDGRSAPRPPSRRPCPWGKLSQGGLAHALVAVS